MLDALLLEEGRERYKQTERVSGIHGKTLVVIHFGNGSRELLLREIKEKKERFSVIKI